MKTKIQNKEENHTDNIDLWTYLQQNEAPKSTHI
jgi:hypothetical protein